jgi:hypothetical protein
LVGAVTGFGGTQIDIGITQFGIVIARWGCAGEINDGRSVGRSPVAKTQVPPLGLWRGIKLMRWVPKLTSFLDWTVTVPCSWTTANETNVPSPNPTNSCCWSRCWNGWRTWTKSPT